MSHNPKKGMTKTKAGVNVYNEPGQAPVAGLGKRWYHGVVTRRVVNSKGETVRRSKQEAMVFAKLADVPGLICRQCPDNTPGEGDVQTRMTFREV